MRIIFRNIVLSVQRLHIRYEDDYYQADLGKKFAFGVTLDKLFVNSGQHEWTINRGSQVNTSHFGRKKVDLNRYKERGSDSANLLLKEVLVEGASVYLETKPEIILPIEVIEAAQNLEQPREAFSDHTIKDIKAKMATPFTSRDAQSANPRNPHLLVEKFNAQAQVFSYRNADFQSLFGTLQRQLGKVNNVNELFGVKTRGGGGGNASSQPRKSKQVMLREFYEKQFDYFRNEFGLRCELFPNNARRNIIINVTPEAAVCLKEASDCFDNYYIA